ncbi:MAG: hypothetical protein H7246_06115 [Phycisphaerae bacterium]|nr:hypothetical protein [Saprospiraceae bacterium]
MKNPNPWVLGLNLLVFGLCFVLYPDFFFQYFWALIGLNILAGFFSSYRGMKALSHAFFLSALVVPLIGLGVCAIIMTQMRIGGSH